MLPIYVNGRYTTQNFSGVQRFATEIANALRHQYGDRVHILVPSSSPTTAGHVKVGKLSGQMWEQSELPHFARDGVLINLGNTAPILARRQIVVIHDTGVFSTPESYSWKLRLWYKMLQSVLAMRRTQIVTVSQFARVLILKHLPARANQVAVMQEGADHMARMAQDHSVLDLHNLRSTRYVLVVGNLAAHKNLAALGVLARTLAERGLNLVVTGGLSGAAFQAVGERNLPKPAIYVGRITDEQLKSLYRHAACFVFPSLYEGFGLPIVEAMVNGCPVVASDIPVFRELFDGAVIFCNPNDPVDISMRVLELLDNPAKRETLCQRGTALTAQMTWTRAAQNLSELIADYN